MQIKTEQKGFAFSSVNWADVAQGAAVGALTGGAGSIVKSGATVGVKIAGGAFVGSGGQHAHYLIDDLQGQPTPSPTERMIQGFVAGALGGMSVGASHLPVVDKLSNLGKGIPAAVVESGAGAYVSEKLSDLRNTGGSNHRNSSPDAPVSSYNTWAFDYETGVNIHFEEDQWR